MSALSLLLFLAGASAGDDAPECAFREMAWCVAGQSAVHDAGSRSDGITRVAITPSAGEGTIHAVATSGCRDGYATDLASPSASPLEIGEADRSRGVRLRLSPSCDIVIVVRGSPASVASLREQAGSDIRLCDATGCSVRLQDLAGN